MRETLLLNVIVILLTSVICSGQRLIWERDMVQFGSNTSTPPGMVVSDLVRIGNDSIVIAGVGSGRGMATLLTDSTINWVQKIGADSLSHLSPYYYFVAQARLNGDTINVLSYAGDGIAWAAGAHFYTKSGNLLDTTRETLRKNTTAVKDKPVVCSFRDGYVLAGSERGAPPPGSQTSLQYIMYVDKFGKTVWRKQFEYADSTIYLVSSIASMGSDTISVWGEGNCCDPSFSRRVFSQILFDGNGNILEKRELVDSASYRYVHSTPNGHWAVLGMQTQASGVTSRGAVVKLVDTHGNVLHSTSLHDCIMNDIISTPDGGYIAVGGLYYSYSARVMHHVIVRFDSALNIVYWYISDLKGYYYWFTKVRLKNSDANTYLVAGARTNYSMYVAEYADEIVTSVSEAPAIQAKVQCRPNPCRNNRFEIVVDSELQGAIEEVRVFNIQGQLCYKSDIPKTSVIPLTIELPSSTPPGVYTVSTRGKTFVSHTRLVVID